MYEQEIYQLCFVVVIESSTNNCSIYCYILKINLNSADLSQANDELALYEYRGLVTKVG